MYTVYIGVYNRYVDLSVFICTVKAVKSWQFLVVVNSSEIMKCNILISSQQRLNFSPIP